jgi:hypothetical protein
MRIALFIVPVIVVLSPALVAAEDTYSIKVKTLGKGDTGQVAKDESVEFHIVTSKGGKVVDDKKVNANEQLKYKEEILEKEPGKRATKLRRTYEKAISTADGKETQLPYHGKTLMVQKADGKYTFQIEKGEVLKEKEIPTLVQEFSKEVDEDKIRDLLLPKNAVTVGASWKLDKDGLKTLLSQESGDFKIDAANSSGTGKLVKAYKKDGKQYGVIQFDIEAPLESFMGQAFEKGAKINTSLNLDVCIDGSEDSGTLKGTTHLAGTVNAQGNSVQIDIKVTSNQTQEEVKK